MTPSMDFKTPLVDGAQFFREQQTEDDFASAIIDFARLRSWTTYHTNDSRGSDEGFPDWTFVREGRLVFAELKREKGGRVSLAQRWWLEELGRVAANTPLYQGEGALRVVEAYLWTPSMWPEIELVLA